MANKENNKARDPMASIRDLQNKTSAAILGTDTTLNKESDGVTSIINAITTNVSKEFGKQVNGSILNYWNEVSVKDLYRTTKLVDKYADYNKFMESEGFQALKTMFESNRVLQKKIDNFNAINNYIPECSKALQVLKTNIMSPDDYSKLIFNVEYEDLSKEKDKVENNIKYLIEKYGLEDYCDEIITDALKDSKVIFSVQSLESSLIDIINRLKDGETGMLTESLRMSDPNLKNMVLTPKNINLTESDISCIRENLQSPDNSIDVNELSDKYVAEYVAEYINHNVIIGSPREILQEDAAIKNAFLGDSNLGMIDLETNNEPRRRGRPRKREVTKIGINGSVVHRLPAGKVVEVKKNNICYGYYLIEGIDNEGFVSTYDRLNKITPPGSLSFVNQIDIGTISDTVGGNTGVNTIIDIFAKAIAEKLDAPYLRKNKDFQMQIYEIMKDSKFGKDKKMKITFFDTSEVCVWECESIFEKIEFFAKLYLTVLTNDILLVLGRSHDKRVFYVNMGEDKDYEQAIQNIIRDIKQKEFKMDEIADINAILQLNPGIFNDYFMPAFNGERPIEIETLAGMNQQIDSDFLNWLKEAMSNGLPVPKMAIDSANDPEFSRTIASQNGMFAREVIRYQKKFTPPFEKMLRILYRNEFAFVDGAANEDLNSINLDKLKVYFPSPLTLNMTSLVEAFASAQQLSEYIVTTLIPGDTEDGATARIKSELTKEVIKDYVPNVPWEKYEKMLEDAIPVEATKKTIKKRKQKPVDGDDGGLGNVDPYAGY